MAEPVKYIKVVGDMLSIYQKELLRLYKKYPHEQLLEFRKIFATHYNKLKETETNKAIDDDISTLCEHMHEHLEQTQRVNKTSYDHRKNLKSQAGTRLFRMTAGFKQHPDHEDAIEEEQQLNDIIQSYKISDQIAPRMRMKWKTPYDPDRKMESRDSSNIGNNNIDLLSYTIPEIQNSIRRLSLQRSPKTVKERELDVYRTLQSRSHKKKYIPRLF